MPADEDRARLKVNLTAAQLHVFQGADGEPLPDIRTADDSQRLLQQLCERVRKLTAKNDARLFGSMAGGRKTMSAALQTAFELYAGRHDRLLHVLLHHRLEGDREIFRDFRFPEPRWEDKGGVPMDQQISITEVPFPRLRPLLPPEDDGQTRTHSDLIAHINTRLALQGDDLRSSWAFQPGRGLAAGVYTLTLEAADQAPITLCFSPPQLFLLRALQERPTWPSHELAAAYEGSQGRSHEGHSFDPAVAETNLKQAIGRTNRIFRQHLPNHQEFTICRTRSKNQDGTTSWPGGRRLAPISDPARHRPSR
jgi:hypothetical protein